MGWVNVSPIALRGQRHFGLLKVHFAEFGTVEQWFSRRWKRGGGDGVVDEDGRDSGGGGEGVGV